MYRRFSVASLTPTLIALRAGRGRFCSFQKTRVMVYYNTNRRRTDSYKKTSSPNFKGGNGIHLGRSLKLGKRTHNYAFFNEYADSDGIVNHLMHIFIE